MTAQKHARLLFAASNDCFMKSHHYRKPFTAAIVTANDRLIATLVCCGSLIWLQWPIIFEQLPPIVPKYIGARPPLLKLAD